MAPLGTKTVSTRLTVAVPGRESVTAVSRSYVVTPGYAEALRLRLRTGRLLTRADSASATQPVLVNEAFVQMFLNGVTPLGFTLDGLSTSGSRAEVVGVVANVRKDGPGDVDQPELYMMPASPLRHDRDHPFAYEIPRDFSLVVRTGGNPVGLVPGLREIVRQLRRDAALDDVTTLEARTAESVRTERFAAAVMGGFSAVALILAAVGLYTVLSYRISTRVREIGVRTALGADPRAVAWLVVGDALRVTLPGMVAGLAGALLASRLLRALLVGIETYDPVAIATAPFVLAAVALVATLVPARRAMRVDPLRALRSE